MIMNREMPQAWSSTNGVRRDKWEKRHPAGGGCRDAMLRVSCAGGKDTADDAFTPLGRDSP